MPVWLNCGETFQGLFVTFTFTLSYEFKKDTYYTTRAVRGLITKINQSKCSIAGPIFSKYWTGHCPEWSRMIPHLCPFELQSYNKSLINQACSGPYWKNIGPRSLLYGPRCARSVLSRPRADILPVRPSRLVSKIYFLTKLMAQYFSPLHIFTLRLDTTITLAQISQYVYHSMSNVSHFPAVNKGVQGRIEKYKSYGGDRKCLYSGAKSWHCNNDKTGELRQIAKRKHKIHVERANCWFFDVCNICSLLLYLEAMNLFLMVSHT